MRFLFTLLIFIWPFTAAADDIAPPLPAVYQVTGVASDDTLNVRAAPQGDAAIIGMLDADAKGVEVTGLSLQGGWARINLGERTGWVARRFLTRAARATNALGLPETLSCFGTEPLWDITFDDTQLTLRTPDGETTHAVQSPAPARANLDLGISGFRFVWRDSNTDITTHILPGQCHDGMSDRAYGLHYVDDHGPRIGCCSLN